MSMPTPNEGRVTLAHSYRKMAEREIRARLESPMSEAERVTAKAELLRRNAGDSGPDTTLATGFAPTSQFDAEVFPAGGAPFDDGRPVDRRRRAWPWVLLLAAVIVAALGWALHAGLAHL